jgi:hypothetical protein
MLNIDYKYINKFSYLWVRLNILYLPDFVQIIYFNNKWINSDIYKL